MILGFAHVAERVDSWPAGILPGQASATPEGRTFSELERAAPSRLGHIEKYSAIRRDDFQRPFVCR
jgi:hypothetical protein